MTTILDKKIPSVVENILSEYGKDAVFTVETTNYDATTGEVTVLTTVDYTRKISPPGQAVKFLFAEMFKNSVKVTSFLSMVGNYNLGFTPTLGMKVTFDSVVYKITQVQPVYSGELIAAYQLILDR